MLHYSTFVISCRLLLFYLLISDLVTLLFGVSGLLLLFIIAIIIIIILLLFLLLSDHYFIFGFLALFCAFGRLREVCRIAESGMVSECPVACECMHVLCVRACTWWALGYVWFFVFCGVVG